MKSSNFKTIGQAAKDLGLEPHVLRFWESKFTQLKPIKKNGRRLYRDKDMELLCKIKSMLYIEGYTIEGARKNFKSDTKVEEYEVLLADLVIDMEKMYKMLICKLR